MRKVWIEAALTGAWSRGLQPGIPDTVEAIIAEGVACARAGTAITHIHAYDDGSQQTLDWQVYENTRTSKSLKTLATPPEFETGTFSLEDAWSRNDINARSDIFTVRAAFEAIAEFRFVGMLAAGWCASPHPGEFIRDEILAELSLSVSEAADVLGVRRATLSDLINGKAALSPEMALRIEKAFGVDMETLLRMQAWYDANDMRHRAGEIDVKRYHRPRDPAPR